MSTLLLATEGGQIVELDTETKAHEVVFFSSDDEAMMGIAVHKNHLYAASLSRIYKIRMSDFTVATQTKLYRPSPDFHQHQFYDGLLYTTITKRNQIWAYDEDLNRVRVHDVQAPHPDKRVKYKKNYNHINNIVKHEGRFYVNLNWLTSLQYASSGVAVFDEEFNELDRFEYGWETHDFQFVDGKKIAICATSSTRKKIHHPARSGIMLEGELVLEHDSGHAFCKGLTYDDRHFYMCGGLKMTRAKRKESNGVICVVNKDTFELEESFESSDIKAIKGAILL